MQTVEENRLNLMRDPGLYPVGLIELDSSSITHRNSLGSVKLDVTGNLLEVYQYTCPFRPRTNRPKYEKKLTATRAVSFKTRNNKSFKLLRSLLYANFKLNDKFITLTFKNTRKFDITNIKACNKRKERFLAELRTHYPDVRYVIVPEYQKRGAVHYHMVCDLPYMNLETFHSLWHYGGSHLEAVDNMKSGLNYLAKYVTKNSDTPRAKGTRRFYASKNLDRPQSYYGAVAQQATLDLSYRFKPIQEASYSTYYNGTAYYKAYKVRSVEWIN